MVKVVVKTKTVRILDAEEVSALTRLLFAMPTGPPKLIGVMTLCARETTSAKVENALAVLAVETTAAKTGRKIRQTDVPTSLATMVKTNARVIWSALDGQVVITLVILLTQRRSLSQDF